MVAVEVGLESTVEEKREKVSDRIFCLKEFTNIRCEEKKKAHVLISSQEFREERYTKLAKNRNNNKLAR